jgi:hypothetical protein
MYDGVVVTAANVIKLFSLQLTDGMNKLECLSLSEIFSLVKCFQVRLGAYMSSGLSRKH